MRILQEDRDHILFEDYPVSPSRLIYTASVILTLSYYLTTHDNSYRDILIIFIFISCIIYIPLFLYFHYVKKNPLTVSLNRQENIVNITHYAVFRKEPIVLPITSITSIAFTQTNRIGISVVFASCKVTFNLINSTSFSLVGNIFYFEAYERVAKKIADFIQVEYVNNSVRMLSDQ